MENNIKQYVENRLEHTKLWNAIYVAEPNRVGPYEDTPETLANRAVYCTLLTTIYAAKEAYLATLPPIPAGYFISPCVEPENGCIGWHCYQHGSGPTGEYYCNGGDGEDTWSWLKGTLEPITEE